MHKYHHQQSVSEMRTTIRRNQSNAWFSLVKFGSGYQKKLYQR